MALPVPVLDPEQESGTCRFRSSMTGIRTWGSCSTEDCCSDVSHKIVNSVFVMVENREEDEIDVMKWRRTVVERGEVRICFGWRCAECLLRQSSTVQKDCSSQQR